MQAAREESANSGECQNGCKGCGCSADNAAREQTAAATVAREVKKILVAVDHGNHPALATALALATPLHAEVAVVHVFNAVTAVNSESAYSYTRPLEEMRKEAATLVKEVEAELPERARAFTCLREGTPSDEIISAAQEWGADLIVMGTHRRNVIARALLGSTSQSVLRHGKCPVLFVDDTNTSNGAGQ
jgi:nucleotide-binding universal stress UspA family protein